MHRRPPARQRRVSARGCRALQRKVLLLLGGGAGRAGSLTNNGMTPARLRCSLSGREKPHVWIKDPAESVVLEVGGPGGGPQGREPGAGWPLPSAAVHLAASLPLVLPRARATCVPALAVAPSKQASSPSYLLSRLPLCPLLSPTSAVSTLPLLPPARPPTSHPQIQADLRTIRSKEFATGYSVRFPRIRGIRRALRVLWGGGRSGEGRPRGGGPRLSAAAAAALRCPCSPSHSLAHKTHTRPCAPAHPRMRRFDKVGSMANTVEDLQEYVDRQHQRESPGKDQARVWEGVRRAQMLRLCALA